MFDMLDAVKKNKIVVVLRGIEPGRLIPTVQALYDGGIRMVEITFCQDSDTRLTDTPGAIEAIRNHMGEKMLVGAGTVLSVEELECAHRAGALYALAPNVDLEVLERAKELGMGTAPGAMTPTEIVSAYRHGADIVKLFPCNMLDVNYIKAIRAPISHIPLLAMGGINAENLKGYLQYVQGVGISSAIAPRALIDAGRYEELTATVRTFTSQL